MTEPEGTLKPGDEGYVEPGKKEPPEGIKKEPEGIKKEPEGIKKEPGPLDQKLEGEGIPDKYKGKTVKEVLELGGVTEAELHKAKKEITQWHKFAEDSEAQAAAGGEKKEVYDPMEHLDEDQARAVVTIMDAKMKPFATAMDAYMLERVVATRPDFGEVKERAMKVFREMPVSHKYDPNYGLDFAYRFAKAEKEGGPPPAGPDPPVMGPSNTGGEPGAKEGALTKGELYVAEKMGMSPESYKKHKTEESPTVEMEAKEK